MDLVEVADKHCNCGVKEGIEEKEHHASSCDMQVTPYVDPCDVGSTHKSVANVDTGEYGARHSRSKDKCPGIDDPQCLPSVNDTPD